MLFRGAKIIFDMLSLAVLSQCLEGILLPARNKDKVPMVFLRSGTGFFIKRYGSLAAPGPEKQIFCNLLLRCIIEIGYGGTAFDGAFQ